MSEDMKVKEAAELESREGSVLTKKDIDKAYFRWWMTAEISANYDFRKHHCDGRREGKKQENARRNDHQL